MPTLTLDRHQTIKELKPGDTRIDYFDETLTGFGVRVSTSGRKTFQIMYRPKGARRFRRMSIGVFGIMSLASAREIARDKLEQAAKGTDPAQLHQERRDAITFKELAETYIDEYAKPEKRSWKEDYRILFGSPQKKKTGKKPHVPLVKTWGIRPFADITPNDVDKVLRDVMKRAALQGETGRVMANRTRALNLRCVGIRDPEAVDEAQHLRRSSEADLRRTEVAARSRAECVGDPEVLDRS